MARQPFSKEQKLLSSAQFDAVFKGNRDPVKLKEFLFLMKPNSIDTNRLGIVISKKNIPLSVRRNRIKRQIRECFRTILDPNLGIDIVVLPRPAANFAKDNWTFLENVFLSLNKLKKEAKN